MNVRLLVNLQALPRLRWVSCSVHAGGFQHVLHGKIWIWGPEPGLVLIRGAARTPYQSQPK